MAGGLDKERWWFGLFNGISTFMGYLISNPSLKKNSSDTNYLIAGGIKGLYLSQWYLSENECNRVTRFELSYFKAAVQHFWHYATGTSLKKDEWKKAKWLNLKKKRQKNKEIKVNVKAKKRNNIERKNESDKEKKMNVWIKQR